MRIVISGRPPRAPQAEVFRGEIPEDEAKKIVGGSPKFMAVMGDFAVQLTVAELEGLENVAEERGITIEDGRGDEMCLAPAPSLGQEVTVVQ